MEQITEIEVDELKKENINNKDREQVELLSKSLRMSNNITLFLLLPVTLVCKLIFIIDILCIIGVIECELGLQFPLIYFVGLIVLYIEHIIKIENKCIKQGVSRLQYGVVSDKYSEIRGSENGSVYDYYVDVIFPESNTKINKSEVSRSMYTTIDDGEKVLVISFDDKKSYSIKIS